MKLKRKKERDRSHFRSVDGRKGFHLFSAMKRAAEEECRVAVLPSKTALSFFTGKKSMTFMIFAMLVFRIYSSVSFRWGLSGVPYEQCWAVNYSYEERYVKKT
jgi:hypothetical protein